MVDGREHTGSPERRRVTAVLSAAVHGDNPEQVPASLCAAAVGLLSVSGASISLMNGNGESRTTMSSSGPVATRLAELQFSLGDGPCRRAFERGAAVFVDDLESGPDAQRWPVFAQAARALGVRAVYSFPLAVGAIAAGTLDLHRTVAGALSEAEVRVGLLVADTITAAVLRLHTSEDMNGSAPGDVTWLSQAAGSHDEVHQATGMVMYQLDVDADEALARLRARAFTLDVTVSDLAREIVARRTRLDG